MEPASRTRLIALAVLLAISVPLIVIAAARGGSDDGRDGIRVEPSNRGLSEIVIYLEDPDVNTEATTDGADRVVVECTDRDGAVVFTGTERWPFSDTDGGIFAPHVHVSVDPSILGTVSRCRLKGTDPELEGRAAYSPLMSGSVVASGLPFVDSSGADSEAAAR